MPIEEPRDCWFAELPETVAAAPAHHLQADMCRCWWRTIPRCWPTCLFLGVFLLLPFQTNDPVTNICQAADKQLFTLVEWAKRIPHFSELPLDDQVILLRAGRDTHTRPVTHLCPTCSLNSDPMQLLNAFTSQTCCAVWAFLPLVANATAAPLI